MDFEDDPHIARIAAALWRRTPTGRAALLVGAGFSANAQPLRDALPVMPGWSDLVERMVAELYGDDAFHRDQASKTAAATSSALRIAQEYETEFGRDALDRLILENVPDEAFGPGTLHSLLLELPWADVLTTNWDTLLERAALRTEDSVYGVVRTVEDIPSATTPRIVKLHGSFPANRPFIFTEEDFRTYPERFAPFLNLARQATMENVLVLIGFSGDDPNFLYWSGWVRDQLGEHAPTIYLVGPLNLSSSRRKMLARRRIQTIDLTRLPQYQQWSRETRRGLSVQWFLERLTAARPYSRVRWPKAPANPVHLALLQPAPDPGAPRLWPSSNEHRWTAERVETEILPTLRHNRSLYPGWVVAPRRSRSSIWRFLETSIADAGRIMPDLPPSTALALAYEMNWLSERALMPLFSNIETPLRPLLEAIDVSGLSPDELARVEALMLALLRSDRESNAAEQVADWDARLSAMPLSLEGRNRLQHERCLWALATLDYDLLDARLAEWPDEGDPFWILRKAALLGENDRVDEARALSKSALDLIRARTDKDAEDIASWSREAYALLFRSYAAASEIGSWERVQQERDTASARLYTLAARGCGAEEDFEAYAAELKWSPPPLRSRVKTARGFDIGDVATTEHWFSHSPILDRRPALEASRFFEEIGAPARLAPASVAASAYAGIAGWLMDVDVDRALTALARTAGLADKDGVQALLTRDAVAGLDTHLAQRWAERLLVGVRALTERLNNPGMARSAEGRLKVLLEMLSRFVARQQAVAAPALDLGLELYDHPGFRKSLEKPLDNLVRRAFKALPDALIPLYRRKLFETRIPETTTNYYKDPASAASDVLDITPGDPEFLEVIARTTAAVRAPETRYGAVMRMQWLQGRNALSPEQIAAYADALWDPRFVRDGLPDGTPLRPWAFVHLPHPPGADPGAVAKNRILELKSLEGEDSLGTLLGLVSESPPSVVLGVRDLRRMVKMLLEKAAPEPPEAPKSRLPSFFGQDRLDFSFWQDFDRLFELAVTRPSLKPPFVAYYANAPRLEAARSVVIAVEAEIVTPEAAEDLLLRAWAGDGTQALAAAFASIRWARSRPRGKPLPPVVWDIAADSVVALDGPSVTAALEFLRAAYANLAQGVPRRLDARLGRALLAMLDRTGRPDVRVSLSVDPGAVRRGGARLAAAMDRAGRAPKGLLDRWREEALREGIGEIREGLKAENNG